MSVTKQAFETQVLELLGPLQGVAMRLTCNESAAEDLVAETVARAWKALASLESVESFRGWIFRILHNTFISELRYAKARPWMNTSNCAELDSEETDFSLFEQMHQPFLLWFSNPEQEFLDNLLRDELEQALNTLPPHHRIVVVLSDLEEFSYQEIAETLEIPGGHRAIAAGTRTRRLAEDPLAPGAGSRPAQCATARDGSAGTARQ